MRKWLLGLFLLAASGVVFGQGLTVVKTCPSPQSAGSSFTCSFTVTNDGGDTVRALTYTNTVPFPGGSDSNPICEIFPGSGNVTALAPTQSCSGTISETAPSCANGFYSDRLT